MFMNFTKLFIYNSNYSTFCAFGENIVQTLKKHFKIKLVSIVSFKNWKIIAAEWNSFLVSLKNLANSFATFQLNNSERKFQKIIRLSRSLNKKTDSFQDIF